MTGMAGFDPIPRQPANDREDPFRLLWRLATIAMTEDEVWEQVERDQAARTAATPSLFPAPDPRSAPLARAIRAVDSRGWADNVRIGGWP